MLSPEFLRIAIQEPTPEQKLASYNAQFDADLQRLPDPPSHLQRLRNLRPDFVKVEIALFAMLSAGGSAGFITYLVKPEIAPAIGLLAGAAYARYVLDQSEM